MAFNDRELLARIIKCEAGGEGEEGMKAVASVIMNRVHVDRGEYLRIAQGSLRQVIYQQYQFDCVYETLGGYYNPQNIYNITPDEIHYTIADWALEGNTLWAVGNSLWYFNPYSYCPYNFPNQSGVFHVKIGNHCFYRPTYYYDFT